MTRRHKMGAGLAVAGFSLAAVAGGLAVASASDDKPLPSEKFEVPVGKTADGRTYGSVLDAHEGGPTYDLIAVSSPDGKLGFIDRKQYEAAMKSALTQGSPGDTEGLAARFNGGELTLPMYDVEGKTVGEYALGSKPAGFKQLPAGTDLEKLHKDLDSKNAR